MSLDFEVPKGYRTSLYVGGGGRTLVTAKFAKEVGLLRTLAQNLISKPSPLGQITQDFLRTEGLARVSRQADGLIAILRPGHEAFTELSESIIASFRRWNEVPSSLTSRRNFSTSWPPATLDAIRHPLALQRCPLSTTILWRGLQN
jgi:hypothetical protein